MKEKCREALQENFRHHRLRVLEVSSVYAEWKKIVEMHCPESVASFVFVNQVISTSF